MPSQKLLIPASYNPKMPTNIKLTLFSNEYSTNPFKNTFQTLQGLKFLHSSIIQYHGNLKSTNCLIDERWQVKLSDFGLKFLRNHSNQPEEMLWTAPEILRDPLINGTKSGDVYSFGIVCVEVRLFGGF